MNHQEFDNYLTLLSSLLRIRGEQREVIAEELRAHLEDRLDDLLARGVDRDAAVKIALEEFGDAAGLAASFSFLVRNRRRRWVVKVTSLTTAALVLLAVGILALWPENRPALAPPRAIAQAPNAPVGKEPKRVSDSVATARPAAMNEFDAKLAKRLTAEFVETPLKEVLQFLADTSDVQIFINRKAIEDEGLDLETPVSIALKDVRLDMLLDLALEQASGGDLTYVERDGILIVSTFTNLEGASEVRVYNCRDLLAMESPAKGKAKAAAAGMPGIPLGAADAAPMPEGFSAPGLAPASAAPMAGGFGGEGMAGGGFGMGEQPPLTEAERRAQSLIELIQTAVKPDSWSDYGGIGTISEYNGLLVINHNAKSHKQVENVLRMLREAAALEPGQTAKINRQ